MSRLTTAPPPSPAELVTETLHGVPVTDPYRWLEDQDSPRTRAWIEEQTRYARAYFDSIPGRARIRERIRELLDVETYDSLQKAGSRYFFRKRLPGEEQPSIYMREGADGKDQRLIDPRELGKGKYMAVKPLRVSPDGRLMLYEIKQGGERTGTFALFDIENRRTLPDTLRRGYLRGIAFAPGGNSFCYAHEALDAARPFYRAAFRHSLGTSFREDREIFFAGEERSLRLGLVADARRVGFLVHRFRKEETQTEFYLGHFDAEQPPQCVVANADYRFAPILVNDKVLAITDHEAPNFRIVELRLRPQREPEWIDVVRESDARIHQWLVSGDRIFVSYVRQTGTKVLVFDLSGKDVGRIPASNSATIRLTGTSPESEEIFIESESFTEPVATYRCSARDQACRLWSKRAVPCDSTGFHHIRIRYTSRDGTAIPMFLVGRPDVVSAGCHPAIMTSYGGYGVSMTPQFSVFVAFLIERGCLFALPNIRGGSEFGAAWHEAARRRNRQTAYNDFLSAAEWLIATGRTSADKLAIFGGSNSGLLVGAAMTQRPDLFGAVVCMVPMLDMLRYHLFDHAEIWREEFGSAEDPDDFAALYQYSPYHRVCKGVRYPATMIVSGDADGNCNPLHARKMTARLQAANASDRPVLLDYTEFRGHSPVLPLSDRIEALTDRMAFLSDQLQLLR